MVIGAPHPGKNAMGAPFGPDRYLAPPWFRSCCCWILLISTIWTYYSIIFGIGIWIYSNCVSFVREFRAEFWTALGVPYEAVTQHRQGDRPMPGCAMNGGYKPPVYASSGGCTRERRPGENTRAPFHQRAVLSQAAAMYLRAAARTSSPAARRCRSHRYSPRRPRRCRWAG